jgi:hypothetical protein
VVEAERLRIVQFGIAAGRMKMGIDSIGIDANPIGKPFMSNCNSIAI